MMNRLIVTEGERCFLYEDGHNIISYSKKIRKNLNASIFVGRNKPSI